MYKQGDIVIIKFPFTDGSSFKRRPALIISNELVNETGDYLLVQITSKVSKDSLSIPINDGDCLSDLPLKSYVRTHKIFTIHESLILSKITTVVPDFSKIISDKIFELIR